MEHRRSCWRGAVKSEEVINGWVSSNTYVVCLLIGGPAETRSEVEGGFLCSDPVKCAALCTYLAVQVPAHVSTTELTASRLLTLQQPVQQPCFPRPPSANPSPPRLSTSAAGSLEVSFATRHRIVALDLPRAARNHSSHRCGQMCHSPPGAR